MQTRTISVWSLSLACLLVLDLGRPQPGLPATLSLDLTTIHAAALGSARSPADSSDAPYLLVSIVGSSGRTETHALPTGGHWAMATNQAITDMPISSMSLEPGDSVRVLLSVLEGRTTQSEELRIAAATTRAMADQRSPLDPPGDSLIGTALGPLTSRGAYWLGSASLLLTNQDGTAYWTRLDCVASCTVLRPPADSGTGAVLTEQAPEPATGVVELTGASGTYHLQMALRRTR